MALTLGQNLNRALVEIGEPEISELDADSVLQLALINETNYAVRDILSRKRFRWAYHRTTLTTAATITTGYVAATNGSTTITSVDEDGNNATNWGSLAAGMYIRIGTDDTSYQVSSVATVTTPHSAVLETAYVGTTTTASSYVALKDEYPLSTANLQEVAYVTCGESNAWAQSSVGHVAQDQLDVVSLASLIAHAHGDLHRNESGRPLMVCRLGPDSNNYPVLKVWPYPDAQYVVDVWYVLNFTSASAFDTSLFGGDAPALAEDAVSLRTAARAFKWDRNYLEADDRMAQYERAIIQLMTDPTTIQRRQLRLATYRRYASRGIRSESQQVFDRYP